MKKRVLCFGDSNTWGYDAITNSRFLENVRWTGLLQTMLGDSYTVIEEGLCGRTTVFEDPLNEGMSGYSYINPCMMSHDPLDYLIVMLGTNDCKARFGLTSRNIACGMKRLLTKALQTPAWRKEPHILLIAPGAIEPACETSVVAEEMGICSERSRGLAREYAYIAEELGVDFLDAGTFVKMNTLDYMHLDESSHQMLAKRLAEQINNEE
ncbi:MAG: GDSL-type esterase/lipase family protein [Hespellia sp.]|nr:GDSL-type esterase/lipase family protein [Hespellia sp.]